MRLVVRSALELLGVNKAILYSSLNGATQAILLVVTASVIVERCTVGEQALYYTFLGIAGMQSLLELGLNQVIIQTVAHAVARMHRVDDVEAPMKKYARVVAFSTVYYRILAVGFVFFVGIGGAIFIESADNHPPVWHWLPQWVCFIVLTGLAIAMISRSAIIEGCGYVADITKARMFANVAKAISALAIIYYGGGLYALALGAGAYNLVLWASTRVSFARALELGREEHNIENSFWSTWRELWPLQSRLAFSYIWGFFIFGSINPILYRFAGAEFAAQFGVTWSLYQGVGALSMAWSSTRASFYGRLAGTREFSKLWIEWRRGVFRSIVVASLGGGLVTLYISFGKFHVGSEGRYLDCWQALPLAIAVILNVTNYGIALYARACLSEIMIVPSMLNGLIAVGLVSLVSILFGGEGAPIAYMASFLVAMLCALRALTLFRYQQVANLE